MADIIIHRCTLHLLRHGGWSWGAEPNRLVGVAVQALRRLLERELAALWPDDADVEVAAPIRVTLRVCLAELHAMADSRLDDTPAAAHAEALRAAVAEAVAQAVRAATAPSPVAEPSRPTPAAADDPRARLMALLVNWLQAGELEGVLHKLGDSALDAWHRMLLAGADEVPVHPRGPGQDTPQNVLPESDSAAPSGAPRRALPDRPAARIDILRARVLAVVAAFIAGRCCTAAISRELIAHLDRELPLPVAPAAAVPSAAVPAASEARRAHAVAGRAHPLELSAPAEPVRVAAPRIGARRSAAQQAPADGAIHSALPFLMLGPLARTGYLGALDVMLAAAGLAEHAALFATALAFKVLEPPERGWRRLPTTTATAARFAGLAEPADNAAVADLARRVADFPPALDRVLADALARGHAADAPLLLAPAPDDGWLLAEPDGVFPIAWANMPDALVPTVRQFGTPTLLVPAHGAGGGLLTRLDRAGLCFLTDARPAPREPWKAIHRLPHERWWTNAGGPEAPLVAAGRKLEPAAEALAACWQQLAVQRRAVVPGEARPLEVSLALAAAVALADVAWTLWRDAGATDPLLALQRFGDLDARLRVTADDILVKLPLGKRALDLAAHGLLDDVAGVPWLAGRVVRFSGGSPR